MATKLVPKELAKRPERLAPGHRLCAGCGASIVVRQVLAAIDQPVVIANATGCLEVATSIYPYTAWRVPWIHNAFENAAATISGVEAARDAARCSHEPEQLHGDVLEHRYGFGRGRAKNDEHCDVPLRSGAAEAAEINAVGIRCSRAAGRAPATRESARRAATAISSPPYPPAVDHSQQTCAGAAPS